jgi:hypothetical protein
MNNKNEKNDVITTVTHQCQIDGLAILFGQYFLLIINSAIFQQKRAAPIKQSLYF